MGYLTERELLERYEYYTHQIEERLLEGEDFKTVSNQLPVMAHIANPETFQVLQVNKRYMECTGYEFQQIRERWMDFLLNTVHPDSIKNILRFLPGLYEKHHSNQVITFVQYARVCRSEEYSPVITFTKPTKLPSGKVVWLEPFPEDFGKHEKKIEQVVKMDEFKLKHFGRFQSLTQREVEILKLLANGYNNPKIADKLFLSRSTVETHRKNLKRKLELKSLRDLMRYAFAFNLVEV
ncbi:MAG: helix-turn-helix transcriptional regulator [Balneolaceae bacterium]|nr:helix-turn-helix transcriptional regulator [Balneolaceae bacterium]